MPRPHPPEFRQRAVELARMGEKPVAQIAEDLGISDSCLRNWMRQADVDEGRRNDGLSTADRDELVRLRRGLRVAKLEVEILKRAALGSTGQRNGGGLLVVTGGGGHGQTGLRGPR
jgi:transposase